MKYSSDFQLVVCPVRSIIFQFHCAFNMISYFQRCFENTQVICVCTYYTMQYFYIHICT